MKVVFNLNEEQSKRAKALIEEFKHEYVRDPLFGLVVMEESEKHHATGNLFPEYTVVPGPVNLWYARGRLTLEVDRQDFVTYDQGSGMDYYLGAIFSVMTEVLGCPPEEAEVGSYFTVDDVRVWHKSAVGYHLGRLPTMTDRELEWIATNEEKYENWHLHVLVKYLEDKPAFPMPGTVAFRKAQAEGTVERLKFYQKIRTHHALKERALVNVILAGEDLRSASFSDKVMTEYVKLKGVAACSAATAKEKLRARL